MVASIIPYTIHTLCTQIIVVVVIVGASVGVAAGAGDSRGNRLLDCSAVVVSILGSVRLPYIHTYIHTYILTYTHTLSLAGDAKCVRITLTSPFIVIVSS
jgi:hypothetical protein